MRKKAAEELKKEQELKAKERRKVIDQRCGQGKSTSGLGEGKFYSNQQKEMIILKVTFRRYHFDIIQILNSFSKVSCNRSAKNITTGFAI